MKISTGVKVAGAFVLALTVTGVIRANQPFPAVPFQYLWIADGDVGGADTLATPVFSVAFPGHARGNYWSGGPHVVDGRYYNLKSDWKRTVMGTQMLQGGPDITYKPQYRTLTITEYGHTIVYSNSQRKLQIDGKNWLLTRRPLHLTIDPHGQVRQITSPNYDRQLNQAFRDHQVVPASVQL